MKATIFKNGALIVSAENGTEAFALKQWWELWQQQKAILGIDLECPEEAGDFLIHPVVNHSPLSPDGAA